MPPGMSVAPGRSMSARVGCSSTATIFPPSTTTAALRSRCPRPSMTRGARMTRRERRMACIGRSVIEAFRCIAGAVRCISQAAAAARADHPRMRKYLTVLLLLFAVPLLAASPRDSMLVSADWLRAHLNDPNLVLLHVGDKAEYDAKHIPGAVYAGLK